MNLSKIFTPKTIAVVGATPRENSVGRGILENLFIFEKKKGKVFYVNPNRKKIWGKRSYPKITEIKEKIDLAIVAVPSKFVFQVVKECIQKKAGGIIIISAGFSEMGKEGRILEEKIGKLAKKAKIPLVGPNSLGIIRPINFLNATFAPLMPKKGEISLISQSGALIDVILEEAKRENLGFSTIISEGNGVFLKTADYLNWLKKDKRTKVIGLYLEGIKEGKRFIKTAKEIARLKPLIVLKVGKSKVGKKAISSHTGALAGEYEIYKAVFKKISAKETFSLSEFLDALKVVSFQPKTKNNIVIITNGGGMGILSADHCEKYGIKLAPLKKETIKKIGSNKEIPPFWSRRNPIDILGDASPERYEVALSFSLSQKDIFGAIVLSISQIVTQVEKIAKAILKVKKRFPQKPIVACFMGKDSQKGKKILEKNKIPTFKTPQRTVQAMRFLLD